MTALTIAPLAPAMVEAAVALWDEAGLLRPWNDPRADFALALEKPNSTVLGATFDGRLVATVMVGDDGHRGWVYYLAVSRDHRGQGAGRAMMQAAENWLRTRGTRKLQLLVRAQNAAVAGFYDALGYRRSDVIVLAKPLEP